MRRPISTVLITGAGHGLGPELVKLWQSRGATVVATSRAVPRTGPLCRLAATTQHLHLLQLDVASDASLLSLSQALLRHRWSVDLLINLSSQRQIVGLDRLDLRARRDLLPFSFTLHATLRVAYAVLTGGALSPGAPLCCVAHPPDQAADDGEFGSLRSPPRVSPAGLQAALRGLAADLLARQSPFAILYPGKQKGRTSPGLGEQTAWIAAVIDHLIAETDRPPGHDGPRIFHFSR